MTQVLLNGVPLRKSPEKRRLTRQVARLEQGQARASDTPDPAPIVASTSNPYVGRLDRAVILLYRTSTSQAQDPLLQGLIPHVPSSLSSAATCPDVEASELQQSIEIPSFRALSDTDVLVRVRKNDPTVMDTSDETYQKMHRGPENLEKRAKRLERERLVSERNRLRNTLERLKSSEKLTLLSRKTSSQDAIDRKLEADRHRKKVIKEVEDTLRRYDQLLEPRAPAPLLPVLSNDTQRQERNVSAPATATMTSATTSIMPHQTRTRGTVKLVAPPPPSDRSSHKAQKIRLPSIIVPAKRPNSDRSRPFRRDSPVAFSQSAPASKRRITSQPPSSGHVDANVPDSEQDQSMDVDSATTMASTSQSFLLPAASTNSNDSVVPDSADSPLTSLSSSIEESDDDVDASTLQHILVANPSAAVPRIDTILPLPAREPATTRVLVSRSRSGSTGPTAAASHGEMDKPNAKQVSNLRKSSRRSSAVLSVSYADISDDMIEIHASMEHFDEDEDTVLIGKKRKRSLPSHVRSRRLTERLPLADVQVEPEAIAVTPPHIEIIPSTTSPPREDDNSKQANTITVTSTTHVNTMTDTNTDKSAMQRPQRHRSKRQRYTPDPVPEEHTPPLQIPHKDTQAELRQPLANPLKRSETQKMMYLADTLFKNERDRLVAQVPKRETRRNLFAFGVALPDVVWDETEFDLMLNNFTSEVGEEVYGDDRIQEVRRMAVLKEGHR